MNKYCFILKSSNKLNFPWLFEEKRMSINVCNSNTTNVALNRTVPKKETSISFGASKVYTVKNSSFLKNALPTFAFATSVITTVGYLGGSAGLFYDSYKDNNNDLKAMFSKKPKSEKNQEGVQTIVPNTKFGKLGLKFAKVGITASSSSGFACGLGEGIPMMALGEAINMGAAPRIETPIGTGLFGIGIASIFSGLALDNTPELKLNPFQLMAEKDLSKKVSLVAKNMVRTSKEISVSIFEIAKNIHKPKFLKENFLQGSPRTVVFQEAINKDGKVIISKALRHNKNYLMHAASFTLGLGGMGVVLFSLLNNKKAQKSSLYAEEGGFLFDNLGMTKYGLDKLTTGSKGSGTSYAIGGVINSVSQLMGLDNKNGRAMQWLGIALVFMGFSVDRGKTLKKSLANSKHRGELTDVVRQWKFDISNIVDKNNPEELKKLLKELKNGGEITNKKFNTIEKVFTETAGEKFQTTENISKILKEKLGKETSENFKPQTVADFESTKDILRICTKKIFGSENPDPIG